MKHKLYILSIGLLLLSALITAVAFSEPLTSQEWPKVSEQRKLYYIFGKLESPEYQKIVFSHSAMDYVSLLDEAVSKRRELKDEDMDQIFQSVVYENEPGSKELMAHA